MARSAFRLGGVYIWVTVEIQGKVAEEASEIGQQGVAVQAAAQLLPRRAEEGSRRGFMHP